MLSDIVQWASTIEADSVTLEIDAAGLYICIDRRVRYGIVSLDRRAVLAEIYDFPDGGSAWLYELSAAWERINHPGADTRPCPDCSGQGATRCAPDLLSTCPRCAGTGIEWLTDSHPPSDAGPARKSQA